MADGSTTDQSYWRRKAIHNLGSNKSKDTGKDPGKDDKGNGKAKTFAVDPQMAPWLALEQYYSRSTSQKCESMQPYRHRTRNWPATFRRRSF